MTTEVIVFPDPVAVVGAGLRDQLAVPVVSKVPGTRPDEFVLIRRLGGVRRNLVTDEPLLAIEAWSVTDEDAHDLAQLARGHLHALAGQTIDDVTIYRVTEAGGPVDLPDPDSDQPRCTFTAQVAMRGTVLTGS